MVGDRIDKLRNALFGFALKGRTSLNRDRLRVALDTLAKKKLGSPEFEAVFLEMDGNGDGVVQVDEFTRWLGLHPGRLGGLNIELALDELVEKLLFIVDKTRSRVSLTNCTQLGYSCKEGRHFAGKLSNKVIIAAFVRRPLEPTC